MQGEVLKTKTRIESEDWGQLPLVRPTWRATHEQINKQKIVSLIQLLSWNNDSRPKSGRGKSFEKVDTKKGSISKAGVAHLSNRVSKPSIKIDSM